MCNVAGVQVEEVGRAVVGFDDCQVLRAEMRVRLLAGEDHKQKGQVGVVRVQQIQLAEVERIVARHSGEAGATDKHGDPRQDGIEEIEGPHSADADEVKQSPLHAQIGEGLMQALKHPVCAMLSCFVCHKPLA